MKYKGEDRQADRLSHYSLLHVKDAVNSDLKHRINTEVLIFVVSLELIGVCGVSAVVLAQFSGQELWSSWV